jgi:hypothetical protein
VDGISLLVVPQRLVDLAAANMGLRAAAETIGASKTPVYGRPRKFQRVFRFSRSRKIY